MCIVCGIIVNESCLNLFLRVMCKVNKIEIKLENFKVEIYVVFLFCIFFILKFIY